MASQVLLLPWYTRNVPAKGIFVRKRFFRGSFSLWFSEKKENKGYTLNQIFNTDETGLWWRLWPSKTLVHSSEKQAKNLSNRKNGLLYYGEQCSRDLQTTTCFHSQKCTTMLFQTYGHKLASCPLLLLTKGLDGLIIVWKVASQAIYSPCHKGIEYKSYFC